LIEQTSEIERHGHLEEFLQRKRSSTMTHSFIERFVKNQNNTRDHKKEAFTQLLFTGFCVFLLSLFA